MRRIDLVQPRLVALLLMPVLLAAGSLQREAPQRVSVQADRSNAAAPLAEPVAPAAAAHTAQRVDAPGAPDTVVGPARHLPRPARDRRPASVSERGRAALDSLAYDWRALGYRIDFRPYTGSTLGTANRRTRTITVYVKPGQSNLSLRVSLAHELGHALDFEHGTPDRRAAYLRLRGVPTDTPWFPCNRCDDFATPAGDFAEVFALWLVGPGDFRSRLRAAPGADELRAIAPLLQIPADAPEPAAPPSAGTEAEPEEPEESHGLRSLLRPSPSPSPRR